MFGEWNCMWKRWASHPPASQLFHQRHQRTAKWVERKRGGGSWSDEGWEVGVELGGLKFVTHTSSFRFDQTKHHKHSVRLLTKCGHHPPGELNIILKRKLMNSLLWTWKNIVGKSWQHQGDCAVLTVEYPVGMDFDEVVDGKFRAFVMYLSDFFFSRI